MKQRIPQSPERTVLWNPEVRDKKPAGASSQLAFLQRTLGNQALGRMLNFQAAGPYLALDGAPDVRHMTRKGIKLGQGQLQFYPFDVVESKIGVADVQPDLIDSAERLSVIVQGEATLREIAAQLLPLWNQADAQGKPAAPPLQTDELAKGLLFYLGNYLAVPSMTHWQAGVRLPLPARMEPATRQAIVNIVQIRMLATGFMPEWNRLLDQKTATPAAADPAKLNQDVTEYLKAYTDIRKLGLNLAIRAMRNAGEAKPFVAAVFAQLSSDNAFRVALEMMKNLLNKSPEILAVQKDGAGILDQIRAALSKKPAAFTGEEQNELAVVEKRLERSREVEIELRLPEWPAILPHAARNAKTAITLKEKGVNIPEVPVPELSAAQKGIVARIAANRSRIPQQLDKLKLQKYGYFYGGKTPEPKPGKLETGDADRDAAVKVVYDELTREGHWSAVNTYEADVPLTLGKGFASVGLLQELMTNFFAKDPAAEEMLLAAGLALTKEKKWLMLNTDTGLVEEGGNALNLLRFNTDLLSLLVTIQESPEHEQKFVDAQWALMSKYAAALPDVVVKGWKDKKPSIALAAHCIWWRSARNWNHYQATGGDVKKILHVIAPVINMKAAPDPARGGALFVGEGASTVLFRIAAGHGKTGLKSASPEPLPADLKPDGKYAGHVFFEAGGGKYYHLEP